jgi:hypothetical protein
MRGCEYPVVVLALATALRAGPGAQAPDAAQVLTGAREALGGEKKLSAVRTFVATGRTRQIRGNNLVPIEFEIACELPDKFVRRDEIPAQDTDPTTLGFNGEALIQLPLPPPARGAAIGDAPARGVPGAAARAGALGGGPPGGPAGAGRGGGPPRIVAVKQDFARLTLGMFATSFPGYPLTFKYAAQAEAPEGKADVLDVSGPVNFQARFVVQRDTHLPVMLMWQVPANNLVVRVPGQPAGAPLPPGAIVVDAPAPPAGTASREERDQYAATVANLRRQALSEAKPVEYRIYYGDFRDVDGLKLPFRIRRAVAGETIEETTFDRIRINTKIDPRKFEAPQ